MISDVNTALKDDRFVVLSAKIADKDAALVFDGNSWWDTFLLLVVTAFLSLLLTLFAAGSLAMLTIAIIALPIMMIVKELVP